ncbi:MAG: DUF5686 family protein, partial [Bacteroidia bacterium]
EEGYYEIVISAIGYQNYSLNIPVNKNLVVKIILIEKHTDLKEIRVTNKRHDPSWDIIQQVIANRNKLNTGLLNYKCSAYIKASDILVIDSTLIKKKKKAVKKEPLNIDSLEASFKKISLQIPDMNFAEVDLIKYWGRPSNIKEERSGVRIIGDKYALYFLSITDGEFDFYKNQVELGKLSDVKYVSPFSPGANVSYRYKFMGSYYEGGRKIYRIKILPRKIGNALFEGETEIYDSIWIIKSATFSINPNHVPMYNSFELRQEYELSSQDFVFLKNQTFTYTKKASNGKREGKTTIHYSGYETNLKLPLKFFGNEISAAIDSAYERNTEWWNKQRKDSLNKNEITFTNYRDSITNIITSQKYLDSIDKVYNKVTFLKLLWWGQGHVNRDKKLRVEYAPLFSTIQPAQIGGFRTSFYVSVNKKFKNKQSLSIWPYLTFGYLNSDLKGSVYFTHLYNPIKRSRYYIYMAREFTMINSFDAYVNMFRRSNFFDQKRLQFGHITELINGLFFSSYITFSDRQDITRYKFAELGDKIFTSRNEPIEFMPHKSTEIKLILNYTPFQKYIREPNEKIILGSKYPSISFIYNQGVKGLFKSDVNFSYIQIAINQNINYGRIGIAKYLIGTGKFLRTTMLPLIDYKYQRQGDPFLFTNPLATFQLLPKTFPTFNWYLEGHYWHNFNGFLTSGLPPFKRFNINAAAGSSILWAFENKMRHIEIYYGVNKVFKLLRQTFKFGIYYANGYNNQEGYYQGLKFSIENYNIRDNSWSF